MDEVDNYHLDIVGLQETRWPFNGKLNSKSHTLYYSGCDDGNHYAGVGIAVRKTLTESVITFEPVNERLCYIRLKGRFQNMSVICFYAPTEDADDDMKDLFYDNLDQLMTNIPDYDIKIILGDANAKVGNEPSLKQYTGGNSLHDTTNENGMRLISFASSKNLKIMSTAFPRKNIHKVTWVSPNGMVKNQIDHVLIEDRHKSCITDIRSKRGAECGTDHYLVVIKVRQRLCKERREKQKTKLKFNLRKLENPNVRKEFTLKLTNRFQALEQKEENMGHSIENEWKTIRESVQEVAEEVIGFQKNKNTQKAWFNENCRQLIVERKKSKEELLVQDTQEKREKYERINRKTNKTLRTAKRNFVKDQLQKAEEDCTKNNSQEFFRSIRYFKQGFKARTFGVRNEEGRITCNQEEILNLWKKYFSDLLNTKKTAVGGDEEDEVIYMHPQVQINEPSEEEVESAIKALKNNKAPGEDGVPAELLKAGGNALWKKLHALIVKIWNEEKIPKEWNLAIIVPIHKKGDKLSCCNYRGISLLNTVYKVLSKIIYNRLQEYSEEIIDENQTGFRKQKSTIDQIFIIKQILSKYWEFNKVAHLLFIDFKKAYDSINRKQMWKYLMEMGIPNKLVKLAQICTEASRCKVQINNEHSTDFEVVTGVRQGDGLSPLLFNLALEKALKKVKQQLPGLEVGKKVNILAFADDVTLLAEDANGIKALAETLIKETRKVGLEVSEEKTKYLIVGRQLEEFYLNNSIHVSNYSFERTTDFKYLGVTIDQENREEVEVNARLILGNKCYWALKTLLKCRLLSRKTKSKLYKTIIQPIVLYGSETWTLTKNQEKKIIIFENKVLRTIYGPINENGVWRVRTNKELREMYTDPDIIAQIKSRRLRWAGHVKRREAVSMLRMVSENPPRGKRPLGRPRLRWQDQVQRDIGKLGAEADWMEDRERWRLVVGEAKNLLRFEWPHR